MTAALALALFDVIEAQVRRAVADPDVRDDVVADAVAEYWRAHREFFNALLWSAPLAMLALHFAYLPTKKAISKNYSAQNNAVPTRDFTLPENDVVSSAKDDDPTRSVEQRDALAAVRRAADAIGTYRGLSRFELLLTQSSGDTAAFQALANQAGVKVDTLRKINRDTIQTCRLRLGVNFV